MTIYVDHPHAINIRGSGKEAYVLKSTRDKTVLKKEHAVQNYLSKHISSVPLVWNYDGRSFCEQFREGKTFNQLKPGEQLMILQQLVRAIQLIHGAEVKTHILSVFPDVEVATKYEPKQVLELILDNQTKQVSKRVDLAPIHALISRVEKYLQSTKYKMSIIHGDLSGNNVIYASTGKLSVIDWTDCRIDVGICDIVQFLHLTNANSATEQIVLNEYESNLNTPDMVKLQKLFFVLYDLVQKLRSGSDSYDNEVITFNRLLDND